MAKTVSLVLGSGGARGLVHVGIIRWLIEHGYQIKSISGCSIGALIGGVYAAGKLDEFEEWVTSIDQSDMAMMLDFSWQSSGIFKGDKIIDTLRGLIGEISIEDLPIPYTAVAANVAEEKEVWLQSGSLFDAIRASISLPLFFTPHVINGEVLIDGGVLNPVPIAPTFSDKTDFTLAVNLGGEPEMLQQEVIPVSLPTKESNLHEKVVHFIDNLGSSVKSKMSFNFAAYDIANQAFDAMQSTIARQKLAAYPADITLEIPRNACGTLEFDRSQEMIDRGYHLAQAKLGNRL
ncbi:patatin-like phospholipase family protein [Vibrio splendidus]|uniref:Patatin-like phospholipase family protein n=1 Tax=Vibrio splendidus TaxID=29497 RepID=A0A2N7CHM6_VIBSP|nr:MULTISPECIES: patatin-like phospholipase family protein [Vibrio]MCC4882728.1 patatin-like phospholipase family protein [Vibrio splendidus]MCC5518624.1 serine protease [Vibrio splendidus]MCT4347255.1 patatin-like phospholipase family protein [Vibrio sp. NC2]MCW4439443.1 patatin-like phospholipase family protein [Vibrio splendidus]MDH5896492.1 patatin-like phospholipase family protein [Vibrio splendidus]